ncbi:phosphatase PAP2 family protein [Mucilaginibacter gilvus]|uniref:Phosphatase PAP2 family protein n=1 Tax=Mucilaginibacter gilvus TaxID=2305909 RepID=A0A444MS97_9SPHI|nr:phosphatase PAP2 family protein [Mucilaginibacter gilvus]RWY55462.1 phosphatase PAP2 family protein [Mucilaginibacter gilvus]
MNKRRQRILLLVLLIISIGFVALTILVTLYPTSFIDVEFSEEVQEHQNKFLDTAMYLISVPGYMPESPIMIVFTSLVFFLFRYKKAAVFVMLTMLAGLVSTVVKALVNRPRPSDDVVRIVLKTTQQSFPSGHVLFYVVFFGFLVVLMYQLEDIPKFLRWFVMAVSLFMIFAIPFSRIYLGAHWFTDVMGGFLLGVLCLYLLSWLYLRKPALREEAPHPETK